MNTNVRRHKKTIPYDKSEYQNVLFSVPLTRWDRYEIARQYFRDGCPKEVFFESKDSGQIENLETTKGDENTRYGKHDIVYGVGGVMGALRAADYNQPPRILVQNKGESQHYRLYDTDGLSPTLQSQSGMSSQKHPFIVAQRGRNPENPKSRKSGLKTEQMLEPNLNGTSNTLTGVEKDNYVFDGQVRKLMPIECERLMGFPDEWTRWGIDEKGNTVEISDSQRYKQCGNGVCSNVVKAIVENII